MVAGSAFLVLGLVFLVDAWRAAEHSGIAFYPLAPLAIGPLLLLEGIKKLRFLASVIPRKCPVETASFDGIRMQAASRLRGPWTTFARRESSSASARCSSRRRRQWAAFALGRLTVKTLHRLRVLLDLEAIQTRVPQGQGARVDERIEWKRGRRWAEYQMDPIVFDKQGRPHDDDNSDFTIRLPERWPRGVTQLSDEEWSVAVPTGYEEVIDAFIASSERTLELVPEPTNKLDPNAIKVIGHWRDARGCEKEGKVGYLPRDAAAILADRDRRMTLHACAVLCFWRTRSMAGAAASASNSDAQQQTASLRDALCWSLR